MSEQMNIQWFPGHMTKARRMVEENLKFVDMLCEMVDARIPRSSRNPVLNEISERKPRMIILNRVDQADPKATKAWAAYFKRCGMAVLETDCKSGRGISAFAPAVRTMLSEKLSQYEAKGQTGRPVRAMVLGIPNIGKSSFINRVAKRKAAIASDRPGVTRGKQWIHVDAGLELLDTPGILWPSFESQEIGENLAFTGAIRDEILDRETLGANLMKRLADLHPEKIEERYKFRPEPDDSGFALLEKAAAKRGFLLTRGEFDLERMSAVLLDEFRGGKLGAITLEHLPEES